MSHPKNKKERFVISKHKGEKRVKGETGGFFWGAKTEDEKQEFLRRRAYRRRNTTKVCSCVMCGNPRHNKWGTLKNRVTLQERKYALIDPIEELMGS